MRVRRNTYQTRNLRRLNPVLAIGIIVALTALGVVRGLLGNEALIFITYPVGVALAAIAWFSSLLWKQALWTVGMLLAAISMAAMFITGQFWLAVGAFCLFIAVIVGPTVRQQTLEDVRRQREENRQ